MDNGWYENGNHSSVFEKGFARDTGPGQGIGINEAKHNTENR
jgi:hypothetical protein